MLTVEEALRLVLEHARPLKPRMIPTRDALGLILAENITSDIDSPPHDKAIVDGYAVRSTDFIDGHAELTLLEEVVAGAVPIKIVEPGTTTRVMTGAPIPSGADAMVMIERSKIIESGSVTRIRLDDAHVKPGQSVSPQGCSIRQGEVVLSVGHVLNAVSLGILSEVGRTTVLAIPLPAVAIVATGNELVPPEQRPGPGQIRNSNEALLAALAFRAGGDTRPLGIARDQVDDLRSHIQSGLNADVLLLSGGVSAGVLDLVPQVLNELGVRKVFHKISLKPGKPLWFGVFEKNEHRTLVFGLPGNPVSGLVCFELFVRLAIQFLRGWGDEPFRMPAEHQTSDAVLTEAFGHRGDRPTYHPASHAMNNGKVAEVTPLPWQGSGDLRTLVEANCLIVFPPGDANYPKGATVQIMFIRP